jgi:hypothetical protein
MALILKKVCEQSHHQACYTALVLVSNWWQDLLKILIQISTVLQCSLACYCPQSVDFRLAHLGLSLRIIVMLPGSHFCSSLKILRPDVEG